MIGQYQLQNTIIKKNRMAPYVPEGEPAVYSPTSPGGSPSFSRFDDNIMAGIVDDPDSDLRDILMLYDVEER